MELNLNCKVNLTDIQIDQLTKLVTASGLETKDIQNIVTAFAMAKAEAEKKVIDKLNQPEGPAEKAAEVFE